jgi:hypothetical protein
MPLKSPLMMVSGWSLTSSNLGGTVKKWLFTVNYMAFLHPQEFTGVIYGKLMAPTFLRCPKQDKRRLLEHCECHSEASVEVLVG